MAAGLAARLFARFTLALILASVLAVVLESEPRIRESAGAMTFFEVRDARPHASGGDGGRGCSMPQDPPLPLAPCPLPSQVLEWFASLVFTLDLLLRLYAAPAAPHDVPMSPGQHALLLSITRQSTPQCAAAWTS